MCIRDSSTFGAPTTSFDLVMCDVTQGLVCDLYGFAGPEPTCMPLGELDERCIGTFDCAAGLSCATPAPPSEEGAAERRCVPQIALGEPCDDATAAEDTCADDGFCDGVTGTCAPRRPVNAPCELGPACVSHTCMNGVCADLLSNPAICGGE